MDSCCSPTQWQGASFSANEMHDSRGPRRVRSPLHYSRPPPEYTNTWQRQHKDPDQNSVGLCCFSGLSLGWQFSSAFHPFRLLLSTSCWVPIKTNRVNEVGPAPSAGDWVIKQTDPFHSIGFPWLVDSVWRAKLEGCLAGLIRIDQKDKWTLGALF
jgi:hypothetical protein